jgi:glycosyltransferase involved in cell wall biosynthesis
LTHNALVVDSANPVSLAEGILHLINNPAIAREIGRNGRLSLLEYFTVERQMEQYEGLYESMYLASQRSFR